MHGLGQSQPPYQGVSSPPVRSRVQLTESTHDLGTPIFEVAAVAMRHGACNGTRASSFRGRGLDGKEADNNGIPKGSFD